MGLNAKDMHIHLCRVVNVSAEISYTFIQRHPLVSGVLLVFIILYIFLSYIYNFLIYISTFLVCTAIFVAIFWSSEQNTLICVNKEEEKVEAKYPNIPIQKRRELFYKYPSQNATSRRRNFTGRKLDVYGGLEEKAKDLSEVFRNEFTNKDSWIREDKYIMEEEEVSLDYELSAEKNEAPTMQTLDSEPPICDLVISSDRYVGLQKEIEKKNEEKEVQEGKNKGVELKEDDQKKLMDLGLAEMERNKRLESLIARRRARKLLKLHLENGVVDPVMPREIAPLLIARGNPYDSPREFEGIDGIERPGSAPSALRSPFDIPYDPNEEKPILKGDSFDQEFFTTLQKELQFCRHESFNYFSLEPRQNLAYPRARRFPGKGNEDWFEQLISKERNECEPKALTPLSEREETTNEDDEKGKTETVSVKDEELENANATKSMSDHTSKLDLTTKITNAESSEVIENPGLTIPKPHVRGLNFPRSNIDATNINDSLYESLPSQVNKNQVNALFTGGGISLTPSHSIASDLQVEVSEVGSPTLATVDDSHEINTTTDEESIAYDRDIDKDIITSGSEEMWGASFNSRGVSSVIEQDISEVHNWRDIASPLSPQIIDEENTADVSSMSSISDMPEDTSTHEGSNDGNIFGIVEECIGETDVHHPSNSSDVIARWKRLMRLMDKNVNHLPHETHAEIPEDLITEAQVINNVNNSATIEQDSTNNKESNEYNTLAVQQETSDEVTINSGLSFSPRSVLPHNTIADQVSSSAYNQEMHLGNLQSNSEVMAHATLNGESPLDTMPQNNELSLDYPTLESHNNDFRHSQEWTYRPKNSIEESNMSSKMSDTEVYNMEEEEKLKSDKNSTEKFSPLSREDATTESPKQVEIMDEKSRELFDDKEPLDSVRLEASSDVHRENEDESQTSVRQEAAKEPFTNAEVMDTSSAIHLEGEDHSDLDKNETILSPNDTKEELSNYLQSESKHVVEDHMEKEKLVDLVDICEDSTLTSAEEELNNNERMVLSDSAGESHEVETEQLLHLEDVSAPNPNDSSKEIECFQKELTDLVE
ncbi:PREDICTED: uncharacterized protein LOC109359415 isoform X2 [Lupinus angustifolius]|uniref:uncharacterized protein LOC109359415 isoform X2 n=1 Tax=Lupinus angustifolius TaxID=3871 RepID=UPI00092F2BFE|nr:PREDICTED: uncharacterized protein LOC109359415 isoform X2 [Lupinus angustifolius]